MGGWWAAFMLICYFQITWGKYYPQINQVLVIMHWRWQHFHNRRIWGLIITHRESILSRQCSLSGALSENSENTSYQSQKRSTIRSWLFTFSSNALRPNSHSSLIWRNIKQFGKSESCMSLIDLCALIIPRSSTRSTPFTELAGHIRNEMTTESICNLPESSRYYRLATDCTISSSLVW